MLEVIIGTHSTVVTLLKIYWRPLSFCDRHLCQLKLLQEMTQLQQWSALTNNCSLVFNGQLQNRPSVITQPYSRLNKLYSVLLYKTIHTYCTISNVNENHWPCSCDPQNGVIHEQAQAAGCGAARPGPDLPPQHPRPAADQVRPHIVILTWSQLNILRCKQELGELPAPFTRQWQQKGINALHIRTS